MEKKQATEIKVNIAGNERALGGTYANNVMVHMNREEIVVDFISVVPPHATLGSRIVISPANFKKMMKAMGDTLSRYEKEFGELPAVTGVAAPAQAIQ